MKNIKQALQSAKGKERIEYRAGRNLSDCPIGVLAPARRAFNEGKIELAQERVSDNGLARYLAIVKTKIDPPRPDLRFGKAHMLQAIV